jgi:hypothetical protein
VIVSSLVEANYYKALYSLSLAVTWLIANRFALGRLVTLIISELTHDSFSSTDLVDFTLTADSDATVLKYPYLY